MIASLRGELIQKLSDRVIVDVGGVGYEAYVSSASLHKIPALGEEVYLHIYTNVREDAITLFGFDDSDEKDMFLLLINVSGVGPKLALTILSGIKPHDLSRAISTKDIGRLTSISGVGKKTAERLCLDLKDKVGFISELEGLGSTESAEVPHDHGVTTDVVSALVNLGYPQASAHQALAMVRKRVSPEKYSAMRVEDLLRETLRSLA